jgi:FkbM family methyltransferase
MLNRFHWRVRGAVDASETAQRVAETAQYVAELRTEAARLTKLVSEQEIALSDVTEILKAQTRLVGQQGMALVTIGEALKAQGLMLQSAVTRGESPRTVVQAAADNAGMSPRRWPIPLGPNACLVRSPDGWLVLPTEDEASLVGMMESDGVLEPGTRAVIVALLQPGDVMLDVGANRGLLTLAAARAVTDTGRVIAVEPDPPRVMLLRRGIALNGLQRSVTLHDCAAGARAGTVTLHPSRVSGHNSIGPFDGAVDRVEVTAQPLDALVSRRTRVALARIGVNGAEPEVWAGMQGILAENPAMPVIIEFSPVRLARAGVDAAGWLRALDAAGCALYQIDEASGHCRQADPGELAGCVSTNLILSRVSPNRFPGLRCG